MYTNHNSMYYLSCYFIRLFCAESHW